MATWGKFLLRFSTHVGLLIAMWGFFALAASAATITHYSDTLSDSAPNAYSNHTLEFKTVISIPPGGFVRWRPEVGEFTVPATDFDLDNVAIEVDTGSGYSERAVGTTTNTDAVSIVSGTSGSVTVTLGAATAAIPADAFIRLTLGSTTRSTSTDLAVINSSTTGSKRIYFETNTGTTSESVTGWVAIVDSVGVGPIDTTEQIPPFRFNGRPTGTISGTSLSVQFSLETDEFANCRYSTASGTSYFSMGNEFSSNFVTVHSAITAVSTSTTYSFYVRCIDDEGNFNPDDYVITFTVPEFPDGTPGTDGTDEGEGEGTGDGDGSADPGEGDPDGGDDTSGGSSGGGGGGGGGGGSGSSSGGDDGGGGFEGNDQPYQSGDGRVIINGYAFPGSRVYVLVDGFLADSVTAASDGDFSITVDEIASGAYTFGVYAIDDNGVQSSTFSTTFTVTGSRGSTLSNINIMPSILVEPDPVDPGQVALVSGFSIPSATITIENENSNTTASRKVFTTTSDIDGAWSIELDTTGFTTGTYKIRARAEQTGGVSTNFSDYTFYGVGEQASVPLSSDLNRDGSVNLIDFSILLFWWGSDGGASDPPADINQDGTVSLTDFSIMIFNWTG